MRARVVIASTTYETEGHEMSRQKNTRHTVKAADVAAILHLTCKHDANGNPRRGYLVIGKAEGWPVAYVDEGYRGADALRDVIADYTPRLHGDTLPYAVGIPSTPATLREWRGKQWNA